MKNLIFLLASLILSLSSFAQSSVKTGTGWYVAPEFSAMFQENYVGRALGVQGGVILFRNHLKAGFSIYQRSGPINPQTFVYALPQGTSYKGQTSVNLRADHGMYGLMLAPTFQIPGAPAWQIDVPLMAGNVGAGFYLFGEDRMTPDGRRVSEWENDLLGGRDSDFAWAFEGGVRLIVPTGQRESRLALGLHYTRVLGWETAIQPQSYYDGKLRVSLALLMGNL